MLRVEMKPKKWVITKESKKIYEPQDIIVTKYTNETTYNGNSFTVKRIAKKVNITKKINETKKLIKNEQATALQRKAELDRIFTKKGE